MNSKNSLGGRRMEFSKKMIRKFTYICLMMAILMLFLSWEKLKVYADAGEEVHTLEKMELTKLCTLTFEIPQAHKSALQAETIPVRLYRIADMTEDGAYRDMKGYEKLHLSKLSFSMTAHQLDEKAKEAAKFLNATIWEEEPATTPTREIDIIKNQGIATDIEAGLYLVCVKQISIGNNNYEALPYILSLPSLLKALDNNGNQELEWKYDLLVDLKIGYSKSPQIPEEPPKEINPPEKSTPPANPPSDIVIKHKTGDDTNVTLLLFGTIFLGISFAVVYFLDKRSRKEKKGNDC